MQHMLKAVFFDQDGVIIDTERDGHRVAFNRTFREFGFDVEWGVDEYHELLQVGGGKERMRHYLYTKGFGVEVEDEDDLIKRLHRRKTDIFIELIESGELPPRPGVRRLMREINEAGLVLGVCTTSNERAAQAVARSVLGDIRFDFILAGDVVSRKKPDPEIYHLALERTGLKANQCIVVEDSRNGVLAARAAGLHVVCTVNGYTQSEDVSDADLVVSCLGDPGGEACVVRKGAETDFGGVLTLEALQKHFAS
jgi:HAD superfamily hydrolase (TIGR01509 family)